MGSVSSLSASRLRRLGPLLRDRVERGEIAGAVALVARGAGLHVETVGTCDRATGSPMRRDTIVRITSMTKPLTAVAALILVEEGRLRLDDPVDPLLPELRERKVLRTPESPLDEVVPASRPLTLRDLLTFRAGIGAVWSDRELPIQAAMAGLGLGPGALPPPFTPDETMRRLGTLPLVHQPGERWLYHTAYEPLAVLVARAAGMAFADFLHERILAPLGMRDTGFTVPDDKRQRLAVQYRADATGGLEPHPSDGGTAVQPSGSTGLFSTADDYLAFARMLLRLGRCGDWRLLARPTVEAMLTDQITPAQKSLSRFFPGFWDSFGWGMGVAVVTRRTGPATVPGSYGWSGGFGTSWTSDPREDLVVITLAQRAYDTVVERLHEDVRTLAYAAIDD